MSYKKLWKLMAAMFMSLVLAFAMTACGGEEEVATEEDAEAPATTELSQEDMDVLLQQVAEKDLTKQYEGYLQTDYWSGYDKRKQWRNIQHWRTNTFFKRSSKRNCRKIQG